MTQEFTATRTMLANAMATAGAELLAYMKTAGALAAIPNTDPQQYVVAGTLEIIGKLLPAVAPAVQAQAELTIERIQEIYDEVDWGKMGSGLRYARAIEREVLSAAREQARNEALEDLATMPVPFGPVSDDDERFLEGISYGIAKYRAAIRALKTEAPAASKEGGDRG